MGYEVVAVGLGCDKVGEAAGANNKNYKQLQ
jgi:hypothetical protein